MNKEDNNINIEVLNNNGDIKLTKKRNPRAKWQTNEYPDEYIFEDVDYVNIFSLIQENNELKKEKEDLQNELDSANSRVCDLAKRIANAIEYIENTDCVTWDNTAHEDLLEILKGSNK